MKRQQILILLFALFPEAILESTLIPLYPFMVRHLLDIPESQVGYYSGLLGSAFYMPLFLTNILWGGVSDRMGKKPVLLAGLFVCLGTTILIGLSSSFTIAVLCRFIAGVFGANSTVSKGMLGTMNPDQESRGLAYSWYGSVYGISGIIGPILGGLLSNPAHLYPGWFSRDGFFGKCPYFLACLFPALLAICSIFSTIYLLEDVSSYSRIEQDDEILSDLPMTPISSHQDIHKSSQVPIKLLKRKDSDMDSDILIDQSVERSGGENETSVRRTSDVTSNNNGYYYYLKALSWSSLGAITLYCIIAFVNMGYFCSLPLYFSLAVSDGGIGLNSRETSLFMMIISSTKLFAQLFVVQGVLTRLGETINTYRWAMFGYVPAHILIALTRILPTYLVFSYTIFLMLFFGVFESLSYTSVILRITETAESSLFGFTHGFASTMAACARMLAPSVTGALFEFGHGIGMVSLVFYTSAVLSFLAFVLSMKI
jgi:MFS family permease